MQLAVVEYARNVLGIKDANTTEINPKTKNPVVHIMSSQEKKLLSKDYGGSMRLLVLGLISVVFASFNPKTF